MIEMSSGLCIWLNVELMGSALLRRVSVFFTQHSKLVRRGGIEPPAFTFGRQHIYKHVFLSFGLEFFLTRAPQERDSAPNTCHYFTAHSD